MLIPSKLICSYRLQNSIQRDRLTRLLDKAHLYPLVLIHAPAGYGKTTLISQWVAGQKNVGWYSLDESDNEAERFATYFSAALYRAIGAKSPMVEEGFNQANLLSSLNQLLIKVLDFKEHFYLIIDDYHLIDNDEIHDALKYWIRHQPENMTLILISRAVPPFGIAGLRVQEQLLEIDMHQLSFNHQESLAFFQSRLGNGLPEQEIIALCNEVEGWPTALQLISLSAKQAMDKSGGVLPLQEMEKRLAKLNNFHINEYLSDEVLNHVDNETRTFVLQCSILRSMNENLVKEVTGLTNSRRKLEELEKQGLFIQQMDSDDNWWRFHPLFASFLAHCCELELTEQLEELHRRAAQAWLKLGYFTEALYHAMQLSDVSTLLVILQQHAWYLFHQGELKLLEESLNRVDYAVLIQHPNLVLLKAWLVQSQHRHVEVSGIFAHFQDALAEHNVQMSKENQAEFDVLKAQVAINSGDENTAFSLASKALADLSENYYYARIVATSIIGEAYHCYGNLNEALIMLQGAEKMARQHHAYHNILWSLLQQSEILMAQGFLQAAYDMLDKAGLFVKENHLQKVPMYEFLLRLKGRILWEWYNLDKAEAMANAGIAVLNEPKDKLQCIALLSKISLVRGDLDNATRLLREAEQLQNAYNHHHDWLANVDQVKLFLWQMTNDEEAAHNWLIQNQPPATDRNHFTQVQWRNIVRAQMLVGQFEEAKQILDKLIATAEEYHLTSDLNRALILRNRWYFLQNEKHLAQKDLIEALRLARQTNFISAFVIEGEMMAQQIRHLLQLNVLDELALHKAQFILRNINQYYRHKFAHFDEQFVAKLLANPQVPELLKISPLTQREWQVLGLIYSGYSNEQISDELQVATTTIKTHIRNLYQKIGVANRSEAISYTKDLLKLMGYI
ncbi:HTH-type transcriptional regulator MalT [Aggregatibacter actinomycetemcomitans]|uniref:HTH-type transcriptional regulator MalT n=1 Tax=Aggregatibacter actinomycetemcomitans TaxID=714 RepID=UPI0002ABC1E7|nr:HTH-type transcriptional regulator MalT [Aggregatibacter actinomycetemcomitans]KOE53352.1 transcriptional regulator MalT [Aggregatibacter actinomycetemcomitans serotype b str. S23A]KOE53443.1 transcriptional regulator MalT [Aggregatibacter actinomycetemcomitans serotype b str. I23C]UXM97489.1 HTH-type transcriptional regulator MalT [Aggregatibacter actinomycetemcomitans]